ncbi:hypothetical protein KAJ27_03595 [bacterium]|nr:hypothetical protein [bacterium]
MKYFAFIPWFNAIFFYKMFKSSVSKKSKNLYLGLIFADIVGFFMIGAENETGAGIGAFLWIVSIALFFTAKETNTETDKSRVDIEIEIVKLADSNPEGISIVDVTKNCNLSLKRSKQKLDKMCDAGHMDMHVTEDGSIKYKLIQ